MAIAAGLEAPAQTSMLTSKVRTPISMTLATALSRRCLMHPEHSEVMVEGPQGMDVVVGAQGP